MTDYPAKPRDHYSNVVARNLVKHRQLTGNEILQIITIEAQHLKVSKPRPFALRRLNQVRRALVAHGATLHRDGSVTLP